MSPVLAALLLALPTPLTADQGNTDLEVFSVEEVCRRTFRIGLEFKRNQRLVEAREAFADVLEACPDHVDAHLQIGAMALDEQDFSTAVEHLERAIALQVDNPEVWEALAHALVASGQLDRAEEVSLRVLRRDPSRAGACRSLARVYERQGKKPEALMLSLQAVALDSGRVGIQPSLAKRFLDLKHYDEAATLYLRVLEDEPEDVEALRYLALFHEKLGSLEPAIYYLAKVVAVAQESSSLEERRRLASSLQKSGRIAEAVRQYEQVLAREPDVLENYYTLARLHLAAGQLDGAMEVADRGLGLNSTWNCLCYIKGEVAEARANVALEAAMFDQAMLEYENALSQFQLAATDVQCRASAEEQIERQKHLIARARKKQEQGG